MNTKPKTDWDRMDEAEKLRGAAVEYTEQEMSTWTALLQSYRRPEAEIAFERSTGKPVPKPWTPRSS